jgi:hypothetical protein
MNKENFQTSVSCSRNSRLSSKPFHHNFSSTSHISTASGLNRRSMIASITEGRGSAKGEVGNDSCFYQHKFKVNIICLNSKLVSGYFVFAPDFFF